MRFIIILLALSATISANADTATLSFDTISKVDEYSITGTLSSFVVSDGLNYEKKKVAGELEIFARRNGESALSPACLQMASAAISAGVQPTLQVFAVVEDRFKWDGQRTFYVSKTSCTLLKAKQ